MMMGRLVVPGLTERRPGADRSAWSLQLTASGEDTLQAIRKRLDEFNLLISEALGDGGAGAHYARPRPAPAGRLTPPAGARYRAGGRQRASSDCGPVRV